MNDQAHSLRKLISIRDQARTEAQMNQSNPASAKFITVCSGKGGVGKSNFTLNFALALQSLGKKVLIFDADIGMANIDVLMGASPQYNLHHLIRREKSIYEIIAKGPNGLSYISGGSGLTDLISLSEHDIQYFTSQIELVANEMNYIIFDTGAGLSKENIQFIIAADECIVVTTPEPTAITDAYALLKVIHGINTNVPYQMVINRVDDEKEAMFTANKIKLAAKRFLNIEIPMLGYISDDSHVVQAVKRQTPFFIAFPNSVAAKDIKRLIKHYTSIPTATEVETLTGIKGFMHKWLQRTK
ncbi:MinD/ParA family protein [Paenibacillus crassostreae]|uniref:Cobyrinic acid a,c-diamide synthase n=1 Tax=Paenibacillus crassostreae TaxID=1763538 RepID=A0A167FMY8_9BACL|nr:MinD/ParA family protein [Paenibacillus crassostreae]AOZ94239.1 cobyrinic acid a,c-diamide synthase [Paenibacillus crassostreae]OAB76725.1 cobyrinic acid a,c-diamide synthase [Paenibacillus crassostreae]